MEKSKANSFVKRMITAVIMAPVVLLLLFFGAPFVNLFCMICGALLAWEWATLVPNKKNALYACAYASSVVMASYLPVAFLFFTLAVMLAITGIVWYKARGEKYRKLLVLGVPYITLGVASLNWLYELTNNVVLIWFVLVVWGVDVGGYVFGTTIKGPKLAPKISPNKTWAGLFGGMAVSAAVSYLYFCYWGLNHAGWYALSAMVIAVVAQCGDLVESKIKRYLGVKDSSNLIPGHGGIFDRVDGLIFAAPFVVLSFILMFVLIL